MTAVRAGALHVVGVGPGDPELLTLKAARVIGASPVVAYFARHDRPGHARTIVADHIAAEAIELRFAYPFTTERPVDHPSYHEEMAAFYDDCAGMIADHLRAGRDVALLCEGDPFLYGSAMYLHDRLRGNQRSMVVPGVSGMSGCWSEAGLAMTHGDDVLCVLPATMPEDALAEWLEKSDAAVVMKLGRNLDKLRRAMARAGREDAVYVERGTQPDGRVLKLAEVDGRAPYFSMALLPGRRGVR